MRVALSLSCLLLMACNGNNPLPGDGAVSPDRGPLSDGLRAEGGRAEGGQGEGLGSDLPATPTRWVMMTGSPQPTVVDHMVASLPGGDLLVAGGSRPQSTGGSGWEFVNTADTYRFRFAAGTFELAGQLSVARGFGTATPLKDGRVVVIGGDSDAAYGDETVEIYDPAKPAATAWTKAAVLPKGRYGHAALPLPSGDVLVTGGCYYDQTLNSILLFNASKNEWKVLGPTLTTQRCMHTMTLLPNGKVLIAGGFQGPKNTRVWLDSLEIFDPGSGSIALTAAKLSNRRSSQTADLLQSGQVMLIGGWCGSCTTGKAVVDIYDPATDKMTVVAAYGDNDPHLHGSALLLDGRLLLAGDYSKPEQTVAWESMGAGSWSKLMDLNKPRFGAKAVRLPDGTVLLVGGRFDGTGGMPSMPDAERFVP